MDAKLPVAREVSRVSVCSVQTALAELAIKEGDEGRSVEVFFPGGSIAGIALMSKLLPGTTESESSRVLVIMNWSKKEERRESNVIISGITAISFQREGDSAQ